MALETCSGPRTVTGVAQRLNATSVFLQSRQAHDIREVSHVMGLAFSCLFLGGERWLQACANSRLRLKSSASAEIRSLGLQAGCEIDGCTF